MEQTQPPFVTVVTATYKTRPDHLSAALHSLQRQTVAQFEVIVSDDSPDPTPVRSLVSGLGDDRFRYRHNAPSLGVARNHWTCFREARGEYIAVLNHDDWFEPTFLERLIAPLQSDRELALAFCDHWVVDANGQILADNTNANSRFWGREHLAAGSHRPFYALMADQTIPMVMGSVFRRSALPLKSLPEDAGPAYDLWMAYLLCREGDGAFYVPERLSAWRTHPENLTSQGGLNWSLGAAECWCTVAQDEQLASVRATAARKAAIAYYSCAVKSWFAGQRTACFGFGRSSLAAAPSLKGVVACCLPLFPRRLLAPLLAR